MIESVKRYGGFYVGRYETSLSIDEKAQSKYNQIPVSETNLSAYMWYGLYAKQKEFSTSSVQGSMIWGSQYDAMLNFAMITPDAEKVNSIEYGNYDGSLEKSGKYFQTISGNKVFDKICNIYDLGGNMFEWTLEAHDDSYRVFRGGRYGYGWRVPARMRSDDVPWREEGYYGSRLSLYIK